MPYLNEMKLQITRSSFSQAITFFSAAVPQMNESYPQNLTLQQGHSAYLECVVTVCYQANITWEKLGNNATAFPPGPQLNILNASMADTGDYRCAAVNSAGGPVMSRYAKLRVTGR